MLCKSWRALETTECGDIITQEPLIIYHCRTGLLPPLRMRCDAAVFKDPLPMERPGTIFPSIRSWTLLLWFVALSLSSSICPLPFFRNTSFSDGSQLPMLESSFIPDFYGLGAPGLESAPLSWDAHSLWRYHWGPRLWTLSHNQWAPSVHLSLNFSPESRHSTAEAPI